MTIQTPVTQQIPNIHHPISPVQQPQTSDRSLHASSFIFPLILCVLLSIAGYLGYRYYILTKPEAPPDSAVSTTPTPTLFVPTRPSPTPIALKAGIGEYTISHPQTAGPKINKVIFNPLDVKKGELLHLTVSITSASDVTSVTGTLTADSQVSDLIFTKGATDKTSQSWTTELTLPDSVWYNYILSVTAVNTTGKTTVQVAPRSS